MNFHCTCGHVSNLGKYDDTPWGWITIPEDALQDYIRAKTTVDNLENLSGTKADDQREIAEGRVNSAEGKLFECPACHRLHWRSELDRSFRVYRLDEKA